MKPVKVIKPWAHYKLGSIHTFTSAETKALKVLGHVEDYQQDLPETEPVTKDKPKAKRTYKRKDLKAED